MKKIAIIIGTRPEYIKCNILFRYDIFVPIYVQQHTDLLHDISCNNIIKVDNNSDNRLNNIIISILKSNIFEEKWDAIMVQGDTVVALAGAICAFNTNIKLIHLESGLRTYNLNHPWPEEGYRRMIDSITNIALCPSKSSLDNLNRENFKGKAYIVGNTSIDAITQYNLSPSINNTIIITLHRRENWNVMKDLFIAIEYLANKYIDYNFIFPMHPNPLIQQYKYIFKKVNVINSLSHIDMCKLISECNCIISDSGGIQEEAAFMGKLVYCCRETTERIDLINTHIILTPTYNDLLTLFVPQTTLLDRSYVYGNGDSYLKILDIMQSEIICQG
jgi:UDP-N-acetylglucosamine 2-epimerase (non-hydrolysing)